MTETPDACMQGETKDLEISSYQGGNGEAFHEDNVKASHACMHAMHTVQSECDSGPRIEQAAPGLRSNDDQRVEGEGNVHLHDVHGMCGDMRDDVIDDSETDDVHGDGCGYARGAGEEPAEAEEVHDNDGNEMGGMHDDGCDNENDAKEDFAEAESMRDDYGQGTVPQDACLEEPNRSASDHQRLGTVSGDTEHASRRNIVHGADDMHAMSPSTSHLHQRRDSVDEDDQYASHGGTPEKRQSYSDEAGSSSNARSTKRQRLNGAFTHEKYHIHTIQVQEH